MSKQNPDTVAAGSKGADADVESDPGKGAEDQSDWADEGGATSSGPASATDNS
jgi:hypothetical protein